MRIVEMKLVKRKTDDGMIEVHDNIQLGKIYKVDLDTLQKQKMYNTILRKVHEKEMIFDVEANGWFPYEILGGIENENS
jgi:hypothetical protein